MMPELLARARAKGSDKQYRGWIQRQPSCISGQFSEWVNGDGRCVAAHYRTAANSGVGCKPEYSCVPLTNDEHVEQHRVGQFAFRPREWWEGNVAKWLERWIES
jgi:hypothetical protein